MVGGIFRRLVPLTVLPALLAVVLVTWVAIRSQQFFYQQRMLEQLEATARAFSAQFTHLSSDSDNSQWDAWAKRIGRDSPLLLSVVVPTGEVVADSRGDPRLLDNHGERPEIKAALAGAGGSNIRYSATSRRYKAYAAVPIWQEGRLIAALRVGYVLDYQAAADRLSRSQIIAGALSTLLLTVILSLIFARRLGQALASLKATIARFGAADFEFRLPAESNGELEDLTTALRRMAQSLKNRFAELELQRSELHTVLDGLREGIIAVDQQGRIKSSNCSARELLNISAEQSHGRLVAEVLRNSELQGLVAAALSGREGESDLQLRPEPELILNAQAGPLRNPQAEIIGAVLVLHDLTELRRLENVRRDFVANVSHELRTPITAIKGFVETLLDGAVENPADARRFLEIMQRQSDRISSLIDDLLTLAHLEQRSGIDRSSVPVRRLIDAAVEVCAATAAQKNISIAVKCPELISARVNALLVEQALVNLIDNAIKYSDPGRPVLVAAAYQDAETLQLIVQDQGPGIDPQHQQRVFERFYRVDQGRSRRVGGTGLGLSIVKHIAQAHSGSVHLESRPGQGCTFYLQLNVGAS